MVEVADVAPVGHEGRVAELDIDVGVDDVVLAEDHLVAEAQGALVGTQRVPITDVHPSADLHPRQLGGAVDLDVLAEEQHATRDDVRVGELELE
ncbi:pyrrolo-quinoline quinone [Mycobacteroides abscessus subsp. abscessus]|nr:pyrrolo-quinoline quinone [Mycobacteroides abscessus subsp. abscessus]